MRRLVLAALVVLATLAAPGETSAQPRSCDFAMAAATQEYMPFAGPWVRHGGTVDVSANGCALVRWRTWRWCDRREGTPCDRVVDGVIEPGGMALVELNARHGAATSGYAVLTTNPALRAAPGVVLTMTEEGTLLVEWLGEPHAMFCRPWAYSVDWCGV